MIYVTSPKQHFLEFKFTYLDSRDCTLRFSILLRHKWSDVQKVKDIFGDILKSSGFYSSFGFLHCQCLVLINMWLDPKSVFLLTLKSYFIDPSPLKLIPGTQPLSCVDLVDQHLPFMNTYYFHNQLSVQSSIYHTPKSSIFYLYIL